MEQKKLTKKYQRTLSQLQMEFSLILQQASRGGSSWPVPFEYSLNLNFQKTNKAVY